MSASVVKPKHHIFLETIWNVDHSNVYDAMLQPDVMYEQRWK